MKSPSTKTEIIDALNQVYQLVYDQLSAVDYEVFTHEALKKWSPHLQLDHLLKSSKPVASALSLPKITFRVFGIPNRDSKSYTELVDFYQAKLAEGATATGKYIPMAQGEQETLLTTWLETGNKLAERIEKNWSEDQLERYLMPHPVLGKLTVREMLFFTVYHTLHHHKSIAQIIQDYHALNK